MKKFIWLFVLLAVLLPADVRAQVVAQGAPATTSDAESWPVKVVFGDAQIDPRAVRTLTISDQVTAILGAGSAVIGHVVVDSAPTTAVTQSGTWTFRLFDQSGSGVNSTANALWQVIRDAAGNARGANVTAANALVVDGSAVTQPVSGPLTDAQLRAVAVPVSGTVTATGPLTDTQLRATAVPVSGPLTDTQLRASAIPVSGTVTATGPLTDTQLRATAVPVSGTVTATGPLTDTQLRASAVPVSGPLTDTQLRASAVPISASALPLPSNASTSALQTTGNTSLASIDTKVTTGSAATAGTETAVLTRPITTNRISSVVAFASTSDTATVSVEGYSGATCYLAAGTLTATMGIEVSFDGTNWLAFTFFRDGNNLATAISMTLTSPNAARLIYPMFGSGVKSIRLRPAAYTSGTAQGFCEAGTVTDPLSLSPAAGPVGVAPGLAFPNQVGAIDGSGLLRQLQVRNAAVATGTYALAVGLSPDSPLPTGSNVVGGVTQSGGPWSVNQTQVNGVAVSTGLGVPDTGTERVSTAQQATFGTSLSIKTATASGTGPFAEICGSNGKTIRIRRLMLTGTVATAAVYGDLIVAKASTVATGGTPTTLPDVPFDANSAAGTATPRYFTVLPTAGTIIGRILGVTAYFPVTGTVTQFAPQINYSWGENDSEVPTLRGSGSCLEVNFATAPGNAPTFSISWTWTEN